MTMFRSHAVDVSFVENRSIFWACANNSLAFLIWITRHRDVYHEGSVVLDSFSPVIMRPCLDLHLVQLLLAEWLEGVHDTLSILQTNGKRYPAVVFDDCKSCLRQMNVLLIVGNQPNQVAMGRNSTRKSDKMEFQNVFVERSNRTIDPRLLTSQYAVAINRVQNVS